VLALIKYKSQKWGWEMRIIPWLGMVLAMLSGITEGGASDDEKIESLGSPKMNLSSHKLPPPSEIQICRNIPYEIDFHTFKFLSTQDLLQMRRVNQYWRFLAEDVIKRDHRQVTISIAKFKWDNPKLQFTLPIYDLKLVHFHKGYQEKFTAFMKAFIHKDGVIKLSFSGNRLGQIRLQYILPFVRQFTHMLVLDLSFNNILSSMLSLFPKCLSDLPYLKLINLEKNLIRDFANPCWVRYLKNEAQLAMVLCSSQQKIKEIIGARKKSRSREDLKKVILPKEEGALVKMIMSDNNLREYK
jgi:hypothetical protein